MRTQVEIRKVVYVVRGEREREKKKRSMQAEKQKEKIDK